MTTSVMTLGASISRASSDDYVSDDPRSPYLPGEQRSAAEGSSDTLAYLTEISMPAEVLTSRARDGGIVYHPVR
jgi:hypothetical protein